MRRLPLTLLVIALAGCGGGGAKTPSQTVVDCLTSHDFAASTEGSDEVRGTSPKGITFKLTLGPKSFTLNDYENPPATLGGEPQRLDPNERQIVRACAVER